MTATTNDVQPPELELYQKLKLVHGAGFQQAGILCHPQEAVCLIHTNPVAQQDAVVGCSCMQLNLLYPSAAEVVCFKLVWGLPPWPSSTSNNSAS